jgi:uncharacterized protein YecE (DUF72 family)
LLLTDAHLHFQKSMPEIRIGTSGWNYREWRGSFFPADLPMRKWLAFYATQFNSVEINYSFYRLPSEQTCESWYLQTPNTFRFALKASRYLTHIKRLVDVRDAWDTFLARISTLKHKLGPILLQFPSTFTATTDNLRSLACFLEYAAHQQSAPRLAMEFRDESCFGSSTLAVLREHRAALVVSHSSRYPVPDLIATAPFSYFRFHGPQAMFASSYRPVELSRWAAEITERMPTTHSIYAYFNNDSGGHAPRNAAMLRQQVKSRLKERRES